VRDARNLCRRSVGNRGPISVASKKHSQGIWLVRDEICNKLLVGFQGESELSNERAAERSRRKLRGGCAFSSVRIVNIHATR
jgi:hypothetical protein